MKSNNALIFLLLGLILVSGCISPNKSENIVDNIKTEQKVEQIPEPIKEAVNNISEIREEEKVSEQKINSSDSSQIVFTNLIFDPKLVSHITPLGELNGGYDEAQTIAGVMINLKTKAVEGGKEIEVRAPTDMTLEKYAYYKSPNDGQEGWVLIFRISPEIELKIDHITSVPKIIVDATTSVPKQTSAEEYVKNKLLFKAGDIIAYTSGTSLAHNWNIYLADTRQTNNFINTERYSVDGAGNKMLRSRCPFDFYQDEMKQKFVDLMGYNKAGQSTNCGSVSKDVAGTLSGMWHFSADTKTGTRTQIDGVYASPLSVFKNSAGEIIIHQVDNRRLDIEPNDKTNKDPKQVTGEHCYQSTSGYAYFKLISPQEMKFAYSSGSCPQKFPEELAKTYYR